MTRLLIATTNPDKLREIRGLLDSGDVELLSRVDMPRIPEPEEDGATFQDNARLKAAYYANAADRHFGDSALLTVAEDSGLVIDALDGEPGVRSARFLRPDATYPERFAEIYRRLHAQPGRSRAARFISALAAARRGAIVFETTGSIEGEISYPPRGTNGFGYDPIFLFPPYGCTLAEVDDERKLRVAHRGHAFRNLSDWLRRN